MERNTNLILNFYLRILRQENLKNKMERLRRLVFALGGSCVDDLSVVLNYLLNQSYETNKK